MRAAKFAVPVLITFVLTLFGCETARVPEEHRGAARGAGIGAATGAVAGAVLGGEGSRIEGALLGGLVGGLVGGAIGHYQIDKERSAEETATKYDYQAGEGIRVRMENVDTSPAAVAPGETVELESTYAVLAPNATDEVRVTESFEIRHEGALVGNPQVTVSHQAGTYHASVPLILPENAERGTYQVIATVKTAQTSDSRETTFRVR
jgi:surface antigen